jgi:membrane protein YqaA with SNARE-associated domain
MMGYAIGWGFWEAMGEPADLFSRAHHITGGALLFSYIPGFTPEIFHRVSELYRGYAAWTVFAAAFTPIPYKVITIAAGVCKIPFAGFVAVSLLGRGMRFFAVAALLRLFGAHMRTFVEKYFNLLSVLFVILLLAGFAVLKWAV